MMSRELERNSSVEGQRIGLKANLESVVLCALLLGVVASFIGGWLLSEDSTGWACFDAYKYHWPLVELFQQRRGVELLKITEGSRLQIIPCFI